MTRKVLSRASLATAAVALAGAALSHGVASAATLSADYQFQNGLSSSVPAAPDMALVGPGQQFVTETVGCNPARVLTFPKGSGVQLDPPVNFNVYSVVVLFRLAEISGYRRILAPAPPGAPNFNTDNGLYQRDGRLVLYENTGLPGPAVVFASNSYAEVAFSYDYIIQTEGYVNALQQFSHGSSSAQYAEQMRFFKDNDSGGATDEDSAGAVARIRIYNGTLSAGDVAAIHAASPITGACDPAKRAQAAVNGKVKVKRAGKRFVVITGIEVGCPELGAACDGTAAIRRGGKSSQQARISKAPKRLGKKKLSVGAGKTQKVKVKLTRRASNALRKKGKLRATISVQLASPAGGPPAVASRVAKLKAP